MISRITQILVLTSCSVYCFFNNKTKNNIRVLKEKNQLTRSLHDLKQPVALMMNLIQEEKIDRDLIAALCSQLNNRIKATNMNLFSNDDHTPIKPYVLLEVSVIFSALARGYCRLFTTKNVSFEFEINIDLKHCLMLGLQDDIERAVENLLSNANKFTSPGDTVILRIDSRHKLNSIEILVEVEDNGKGLTGTDINSMWLENYKGQNDSLGSGIGLPSIRSFACSEGGTTWAHNNSLGGCTIGFSFVSDSIENPQTQTPKQSTQPTDVDFSLPPITEAVETLYLLYVEDDYLQRRINLKQMEKIFLNQDICIDIATEGSEGLNMLRKYNYAAVVTDMNMPVMDGATMFKIARAEGVLPDIAKILSAQIFGSSTLKRYGISNDQFYDKTDFTRNIFKDVSKELKLRV